MKPASTVAAATTTKRLRRLTMQDHTPHLSDKWPTGTSTSCSKGGIGEIAQQLLTTIRPNLFVSHSLFPLIRGREVLLL